MSSDSFVVITEIQDADGNVLNDADNLVVSLSLENVESYYSGLVVLDETTNLTYYGLFDSGDSEAGFFNSTSFRVLSYGNFTVLAEGSGDDSLLLVSNYSEMFFVVNKVSSSLIELNTTNITNYQVFDVYVWLYGEDNETYLGDANVSFNEILGVIYEDEVLEYSLNQSVSTLVYSEYSGILDINVTTTENSLEYESDIYTIEIDMASIILEIYPIVIFI